MFGAAAPEMKISGEELRLIMGDDPKAGERLQRVW